MAASLMELSHPMTRPKILYLTPTPIGDRSFGGAIRSNDLRVALCEVGDVDTLVLQGGPAFHIDADFGPEQVKTLTYTARGLSWAGLRQRRRVRQCIGALLERGDYRFIVARYAGQADVVPRQAWDKLIVDPDDIHKNLNRADGGVLARLRCSIRNAWVARMLRRALHVWIVNPNDQVRLGAARSSLLSNVVAVPALGPAREPPVAGRILMVGFFPHPPNAHGLRWFAESVLPSLQGKFAHAELHAIGKCPPDLAGELAGRVSVRGYVDDLAAEYAKAALVIAPIFSGAGSQIKVIDALAHARPLVATRFATEGFSAHLHDGEHLRVAGDDASGWIAACTALLQNPEKAEAMAARAREKVAKCFGVSSMVVAVRQTLTALETNRR